MSTIKNKKTAIIGGGPAGLTLARLLQLQGADVTVYERDADRNARAQGATLDLHEESGLAALAEAGLMDAFRANYRPGADRVRVMDKGANIIFDEHTQAQDETERRRPEIDRGPLQDILLDSLQPGTVVWNRAFSALIPEGNAWKIIFKDGTSAVADLVVAADGAYSKVRPYLTPVKPFYAGYTALEGAVYASEIRSPRMHELLKGGKIFAFGDNKTLIVSAKGDGSLVFYPSFKTDEGWSRDSAIDFTDKAQVLTWFRQEFTGWDEVWQELFRNASGPFVPRPIYCMPLDQSWEAQPNLTMLGDAAHLMPPYAGEGVNMAMLDALELARHLASAGHPDMLTAIAAYEQQMRARAAEVAAMSLDAMVALHEPDAISFMLAVMGEEV